MARGSSLNVQDAMEILQLLPGSVHVKFLGVFVNTMDNGQSNSELSLTLLLGSSGGKLDKGKEPNHKLQLSGQNLRTCILRLGRLVTL